MAKKDMIRRFVQDKIDILQERGAESKSALAKLRRGLGKNPSEVPEVWSITMDGLPDELLYRRAGDAYDANEAEWAIHIALTFYAMHQQGNDRSSNNDVPFAEAIYSLISPEKNNAQSIKRRFDAIITSEDLLELSQHARGMIQIMKSSNNVAFDYPEFAKDLYLFSNPEWRKSVRLAWGKHFYKKRGKEKDSEKESKKNEIVDKEE